MRYGMRTTLSWIPGHANIAGNEITDQLAPTAVWLSDKILISVNPSFKAAMQCSNTMSIATNSASSMDPLCATSLMRYRIRTTLSWIPGHANIAGNEIAKEAAKESMSLNEQYISCHHHESVQLFCFLSYLIGSSSLALSSSWHPPLPCMWLLALWV
jgi:ribonuclease HI